MNSVRDMRACEIELVVDYFSSADSVFLIGMGVDKSKLPGRKQWANKLSQEINEEKRCYVAWLVNDKLVGHSNLSDIDSGNTASVHMHIWESQNRKVDMARTFCARRFRCTFIVTNCES